MGIHDKIRAEAKLDSRRFGKSIVCRIITGPLLSFIEQKRLSPEGVFFNNTTGLDPINNKMIVIPLSKIREIEELFNSYQAVPVQNDGKFDIEYYEKNARLGEALIAAISQSIVLVTINHNKPEGVLAGPPAAVYDVLIDSLDVNQTIEGTYVYRSSGINGIREKRRFDQ